MVIINSVKVIFDPRTEQKDIDIFRRENPEWIEETTTVSVSFILQHTTYHDLTMSKDESIRALSSDGESG